jgi:hypothetical protein
MADDTKKYVELSDFLKFPSVIPLNKNFGMRAIYLKSKENKKWDYFYLPLSDQRSIHLEKGFYLSEILQDVNLKAIILNAEKEINLDQMLLQSQLVTVPEGSAQVYALFKKNK